MYKTADWVLRRRPRPRVLKSHECFDARYRRVIYIVRDARDVAISNYHWEMKLRSISEDCPLEEFVPRWMAGTFGRRIASWSVMLTVGRRRARDTIASSSCAMK